MMNKYLRFGAVLLAVFVVGRVECLTVDAYGRAIIKDLKGPEAAKFKTAGAALYQNSGKVVKGLFDDDTAIMQLYGGQVSAPSAEVNVPWATDKKVAAEVAKATSDDDKLLLKWQSLFGAGSEAYGRQVVKKLTSKKTEALKAVEDAIKS